MQINPSAQTTLSEITPPIGLSEVQLPPSSKKYEINIISSNYDRNQSHAIFLHKLQQLQNPPGFNMVSVGHFGGGAKQRTKAQELGVHLFVSSAIAKEESDEKVMSMIR